MITNATVRIFEKSLQNMKVSVSDPRNKIARRSVDETIAGIRSARESWEIGVNEELLAVAAESRRDFAICR